MRFGEMHAPMRFDMTPKGMKALFLAMGAVFVLQLFFNSFLIQWFGLTPSAVWRHHRVWQLITYAFLHGSFFHILFNVFTLWMFGRELQGEWGNTRFTLFCLGCAGVSGLCLCLIFPNSPIPTIGASGMVYAVLAAFARRHPTATMYLYMLIPMEVRYAVLLFAGIEFYSGVTGSDGVSHTAHLGGMAAGYAYARWGFRWEKQLFAAYDRLRLRRRPQFYAVLPEDTPQEVDRILEKILRQGKDTLTSREKTILDRYSQTRR